MGKTRVCVVSSRMQPNIQVALIFSLLFPNLCFGKYLLVNSDSDIVPGMIEDANKDTSVEDKDDHDVDKEDDVSYEIAEDPAWNFGPSPAHNINGNSNRYKQGCHKHKCNG